MPLEVITLAMRVPYSTASVLEQLHDANKRLAYEIVDARVGNLEVVDTDDKALGDGMHYKLVADPIKWLQHRSYKLARPLKAVLERFPAINMSMETFLGSRVVQSHIRCVQPMPNWGSISCATAATDEPLTSEDLFGPLPKGVNRNEFLALKFNEQIASPNALEQENITCTVYRRLILHFHGPYPVYLLAGAAVRHLACNYFTSDLRKQLAASASSSEQPRSDILLLHNPLP
mmetsp:Transcript_26150/g.43243  ORF Transcript_26150/g.43243 Transcript_26150/m.43243 type:complete len:232 (+) Transcript_26150:94-789(+)|eukprot:CAMPEP_0119326556 /NCGR_PEP_ID=MMETSP1333-20130426/68682_1 /TAXON_ID=418940 /ORGANISM="Scyphosphaera apsteinii, Strain RCC1455" /LENGTH=231 /DNA_ID=CAMNT_0007334891 /DNA_START=83 /DNA_END=778 /DNA_ORIENTATION=+